ncbi:MAG: hypothetical protein DRO67_08115 [Candidatus Asgardarchaeum californiense]|nr:MAG: hypothetical protein DRO67_08115 [Candidatus Asgardarchaeum californiense]
MRYSQVVRYVDDILSQYPMPLTLRQIFYRLIADYNYPNKSSAYAQLSKQLVKARERGDIDETRIEDRSRSFIGGDNGFDDLDDFLQCQIDNFLFSPNEYSRKMWSEQPEFVIVWVEKDALSRVISVTASKYRVITAPSRGYASYSYIREAIKILPDDKEITILHFADHDPSGLDMTRDLYNRFNDYASRRIEVERIALSYDQIRQYNLAPNPTKSADPRHRTYVSQFGNQCWELDAVEPNELQRLVKRSIVKHINPRIWNSNLSKQEQEREKLRRIFSEINGKFQEMGLL